MNLPKLLTAFELEAARIFQGVIFKRQFSSRISYHLLPACEGVATYAAALVTIEHSVATSAKSIFPDVELRMHEMRNFTVSSGAAPGGIVGVAIVWYDMLRSEEERMLQIVV